MQHLQVRLKEIERNLRISQTKEKALAKENASAVKDEGNLKNTQPEKPHLEERKEAVPPKDSTAKTPRKQTVKNDEKGLAPVEAQKFSDHEIIGDDYKNCRIVQVSFQIDKKTNGIYGFQAFYKNIAKNKIIEGKKNFYDSKKDAVAQVFECKDHDYLKSIFGQYNKNNEIESINLVSNLGQNKKFGAQYDTNKNTFALNIADIEVPVCLYGSLSIQRDPKTKEPIKSLLCTIGAEILRDEVPE